MTVESRPRERRLATPRPGPTSGWAVPSGRKKRAASAAGGSGPRHPRLPAPVCAVERVGAATVGQAGRSVGSGVRVPVPGWPQPGETRTVPCARRSPTCPSTSSGPSWTGPAGRRTPAPRRSWTSRAGRCAPASLPLDCLSPPRREVHRTNPPRAALAGSKPAPGGARQLDTVQIEGQGGVGFHPGPGRRSGAPDTGEAPGTADRTAEAGVFGRRVGFRARFECGR